MARSANKQLVESLNSARKTAEANLKLRRRLKTVFKRLRNDDCTSVFLSHTSYDEKHTGTAFLYFRKNVKNMKKDMLGILGRVESLSVDGTWESNDTEDGNRLFQFTFWHNTIKIYISVTAVVEADGLCRKVVVGERVETVRSPVYQIICPE